MSGVFKGIGKVFKAVGKVVGGVVNGVKHVVEDLWHSPIVRAVAIGVAAYFTMGAIAGAFAASGAASGATAAATVGDAGGSLFGAAGGAALGADTATLGGAATAAFGDAAATGAAEGIGGLAGAAMSTFGAAAPAADAVVGGLLGTQDVGGLGLANAAEQTYAPTLASQMDMAAFTGQGVTQASIVSGMPFGDAVANGSLASLGTANAGLTGQLSENLGQSVSDLGATDPLADTPFSSSLPGTVPDASSAVSTDAATQAPQATSFLGKVEQGVSNIGSDIKEGVSKIGHFIFGSSGTPQTLYTADGQAVQVATGGSSGLFGGGIGKEMLLSNLMNIGASLLEKPQPQMQFAGVKGNGSGQVTGITTTPGGFGLQVGTGEAPPSSVPQPLKPPGAPGLLSAPQAPTVAATSAPAAPTLAPPRAPGA